MNIAARGLSKYSADLPHVEQFFYLGEGDTPVVDMERPAADLGLRALSAKMETANPTGSYKDRVAAMSVSLVKTRGYRGWLATSSGNAGIALAAYGARAGVPGCLFVAGSAPAEKRVSLVPYPTNVIVVDGVGRYSTRDREQSLFEQIVNAAARHDLFLCITANVHNPDGMRGIDSIGYELAAQVADATHVYVPSCGGGLITCVGRGLAARGKSPQLVVCQPEGCAPIVRFVAGELSEPRISSGTSEIAALQSPNPPDGFLAADMVARSGGWGTSVSDEAVFAAQRMLVEQEGIFVEPAAATAYAAVVEDVKHGRLGPDDHPVLILTGAGWKQLEPYYERLKEVPRIQVEGATAAIDDWSATIGGLQ